MFFKLGHYLPIPGADRVLSLDTLYTQRKGKRDRERDKNAYREKM